MSYFTSSSQKEIDVWIQDQSTPPFQVYLLREDKTDITLTSDVSAGDTVVNVSSGHGFTAGGESLALHEVDNHFQSKVKSVATDAITLYEPVGKDYSTNAVVVRGSIEMNVNGTTPQTFTLNLRDGLTPIDFQYVQITIHNASAAGDDATFGDLTALTNGLRFYADYGELSNLGLFRANSDFREYGAEVIYHARAGGGGTYGVDITFDLKRAYGIVLRLDPRLPMTLNSMVQDNVSTLNRLRVSLMGQYTTGE